MAGANSISVTALQIINGAAQELGILAGGEQLQASDQAWGLQKLQRMLDTYNAKRVMIWANFFQSFALSPGTAPHTIGPAIQGGPVPTFSVNQRPVEIPTIGLQLVNTQPTTVEIPLTPRDKEWWAAQRVKNLTSAIPTDFYYEPDWPLGSIYFWPVPNAANNVLLQMRTVIIEPGAYNTSISMPPGYWNLLNYELAIELAPSFDRQVSQDLRERFQQAKNAVLSNNVKSPRGYTVDAGMPGGSMQGGDFNYYSGAPNQ